MRSTEGINSQWPNDMVINTSVNERGLLELLFVRSLLHPFPEDDVPATVSEFFSALEQPPTALREQWTREWHTHWDQKWAWLLKVDELKASGHIDDLFDVTGTPPQWGDVLYSEYFPTDVFDFWLGTLPNVDRTLLSYEEQPERQSVEQLRGAWEHGLTSLFVLPYENQFVQRRGEHALEMSRSVYLDAGAFSAALLDFSAN